MALDMLTVFPEEIEIRPKGPAAEVDIQIRASDGENVSAVHFVVLVGHANYPDPLVPVEEVSHKGGGLFSAKVRALKDAQLADADNKRRLAIWYGNAVHDGIDCVTIL